MHLKSLAPLPPSLFRALALVALIVPGLAGRSSAAELKPALEAGRSWTYDLAVDLVVAQGEEVSRLVQSARLTFTVASVDDATNEATIRAAFRRIMVMWTEPGKQVEFLWNEGENGGAGDSEHAAVWRALTACVIELRVSSSGEVVGVAGLDEVMEMIADAQEGAVGVEALGMFAPSQATSTFTPIWRADGLVDAAPQPGTGWQTSTTVPLGPAGALRFTYDLVVTGVEGAVVQYAGDEVVATLRPADPDPASPAVEIAEHTGRIEGAWSKDAGALQRRTATRRIGAAWTLGDLKLLQAQTLSYTIARVAEE